MGARRTLRARVRVSFLYARALICTFRWTLAPAAPAAPAAKD